MVKKHIFENCKNGDTYCIQNEQKHFLRLMQDAAGTWKIVYAF